MTPATTFGGKHVALFGLGGSGLATAGALVAGGANLLCWDDGANGREKAAAAGLQVADLREVDWAGFDSFVLSPGVPLTHPTPHWTVDLAREAGVEIIGDIEIFCRERARLAPDAPFVAITGTNGKSTTTALIAHLLRELGDDVQMGGNIGVPVLSLAPPSGARVHVLELSTFQIDLNPSLRPSVGVLLNLTPDHLDRHGAMENYAAIKERLVVSADAAVIAIDDDFTRAIAGRLLAGHNTVTLVSTNPHLEEARSAVPKNESSRPIRRDAPAALLKTSDCNMVVADGQTLSRIFGETPEPLADLTGIPTLRGQHNAQNAAAALAAVLAVRLGADTTTLQAGLRSFAGLPHRMEEVGRDGRVLFVNDSKATNADATEKALTSFHDIFWILGGKAKDGGIAPLASHFPRVAKAYLIGEASDAFAATLDSAVPHERCGTLDIAVRRAAADAAQSPASQPVVLLSPACASYDQFPNYEIRGDSFRDLVRQHLSARPGAAA